MSDLGFDPRGYCERLAKACPERYRFAPNWLSADSWSLLNANYSREAYFHSHWLNCNVHVCQGELWKFFGPLADERKIEPWRIAEHAIYVLRTGTLLESIIAAVVESFESEVKA